MNFAEEMKRKFEMSMVGELNYFLGLQVKQRNNGIFIFQEKYAKNLVKRFGLDSKKHTSTPMSSSAKLSLDAAGVDVDPTLYRSMISSLLYLTSPSFGQIIRLTNFKNKRVNCKLHA